MKTPRREIVPENRKRLRISGEPWQVQSAKARFSEVFRRARTEGPQLITRQGTEGVVMMPVEQFEQLVRRARRPKSLVQFFRESPLVGLELKLVRNKDRGRTIQLWGVFCSTPTVSRNWSGSGLIRASRSGSNPPMKRCSI